MPRLDQKIKWFINEKYNLLFKFRHVSKLRELKDTCHAKSIFLVGNGPSITYQNINFLHNNEVDFATVNCGYRIFTNSRPTYHFVADQERFNKFRQEILSCQAKKLFIREGFDTNGLSKSSLSNIYQVPYRSGGLSKRGYKSDISLGLGNDSNVLLFATQVLIYMGYKKIYIIGCDLSYNEKEKYAYEMTNKDLEHEDNLITQAKRINMIAGDLEFKLLQNSVSENGIKLFNAGHGGNLKSLQRIPLEKAYMKSTMTLMDAKHSSAQQILK